MSKGAKILVNTIIGVLVVCAVIVGVLSCVTKTNEYMAVWHNVKVVDNEPVFIVRYYDKETQMTNEISKKLEDITELERFVLYVEKVDMSLSYNENYNVIIYKDVFNNMKGFELKIGE